MSMYADTYTLYTFITHNQAKMKEILGCKGMSNIQQNEKYTFSFSQKKYIYKSK